MDNYSIRISLTVDNVKLLIVERYMPLWSIPKLTRNSFFMYVPATKSNEEVLKTISDFGVYNENASCGNEYRTFRLTTRNKANESLKRVYKAIVKKGLRFEIN